jgi:predicted ferric reductase
MIEINQSKRKQLIIFGLIIWALNIWQVFNLFQVESISIKILSYLGIYFLALISLVFFLYPFYDSENRGFGIEDHFKKMYLIIHVLILILHGFNFIFEYPWGLVIFILTFSVIAIGSNLILLILHLKDKDKTPPNYFYSKSWREDF